jgi:4'-phosphopantetheinyl transferase
MISATSRQMISIINNSNSVVAYWKQVDYNESIRNGVEKRFLEQKAIGYLLNKLGYDPKEVTHKETGQPYLINHPDVFLSISHAKGWFAICLGSEPVGVDIQTYSARLIQGQDYFRNENEGVFAEDEQALHLIWGAKEAFYKLKEGQIVDLKQEVTILAIDHESIHIDFEGARFLLNYSLLEDSFLVYTTKES